MTEAESDALEAQVPALAAEAGARAYLRAQELGSVLIARDGALVEVLPDGTSRVLRPLPERTRMAVGTVFVARDWPPPEPVADTPIVIEAAGAASCR